MHAVHAALDAAPAAADHVPAGQGVGAVDPAGQKEPGEQAPQVAFDDAPATAEKVPAGHGVGLTDAKGQKEPGGQRTGRPAEHQKDSGQGVHVSARTRRLPSSATMTTPAGVTATPTGLFSRAAVPQPSAHEAVAPAPAIVVTLPVGETRRMQCWSAIKILPPASNAINFGSEKVTLGAGPSANPAAPLPLKVVTTPASVIFRIRLFVVSDT